MTDEIVVSIWKIPFEIKGNFALELPLSSKILKVGNQDSQACLWISFPHIKGQPINKEFRFFAILPTGNEIVPWGPYQVMQYIDTFQIPVGRNFFVGHLFENLVKAA